MKVSDRKERRATAFQRRSTFWLGLLRWARLSDFLWQKMWKLNLVIISLSDVWFSHYTHLPINLFSHSNDSEQGSFLFQKNGSKTHFFFQIDNTLPDSNVLHNGRGEGEAQTGIFKACLNSLSGKLCGSDHRFKRSLNLNSILGFHRHCLVCTFFYINVIVVVILQSLILHGLSH